MQQAPAWGWVLDFIPLLQKACGCRARGWNWGRRRLPAVLPEVSRSYRVKVFCLGQVLCSTLSTRSAAHPTVHVLHDIYTYIWMYIMCICMHVLVSDPCLLGCVTMRDNCQEWHGCNLMNSGDYEGVEKPRASQEGFNPSP